MFELKFQRDAKKALLALHDDNFERCMSALALLSANPFPGIGGDKEKLKGYPNKYRIHIGRSYTAIYEIYKDEKEVHVIAFGSIDKMHKKYDP